MASSSPPHLEPTRCGAGNNRSNTLPFRHSAGQLMQSVTANLFSRFSFPFHLNPNHKQTSSRGGGGAVCSTAGAYTQVCSSSTLPPCASGVGVGGSTPILFPFYSSFSNDDLRQNPSAAASPAIRSLSTSVRIDGLGKASKGGRGGPAFVGQVFSMCDPSGTGLMAVTTHFDIPFLSKRTPEWIKKMLATFTKNDKNGPVFRFFMDLGDAVSYVKKLSIPTGMVGACRLDVAYEHFKEKPHMFQFVPNERQVKAANKLLKTFPHKSGKRKLDGVPVFTAQNLNIAIATNDGIKWYTPYFFDKSLLDNILEASIDQHFHTLIRNRHVQRRRDVIDDNLTAEVVEDNGDSLFEPPEVQELLDEMGHPGIPLRVISKAAEIQLLDVVDKVLLGNKWLRRATGIQPKFPYLVDSFEARSEASFMKAAEPTKCALNSGGADNSHTESQIGAAGLTLTECVRGSQGHQTMNNDFRFPFGDWFWNPWLKPSREDQGPNCQTKSDTRMSGLNEESINQAPPNPLLPKITMVGISTGEAGQVSRATLKKTMDDLTRELEQSSQRVTKLNEDKDPLFVANVGDYSSITRVSSA